MPVPMTTAPDAGDPAVVILGGGATSSLAVEA
jgi:hypothetical protein